MLENIFHAKLISGEEIIGEEVGYSVSDLALRYPMVVEKLVAPVTGPDGVTRIGAHRGFRPWYSGEVGKDFVVSLARSAVISYVVESPLEEEYETIVRETYDVSDSDETEKRIIN